MAVTEKETPRLLSYAAIFGGGLLTLLFWYEGQTNPRTWTANMAINKHSTYGFSVGCMQCHTKSNSAFRTSMTCQTANCHGDLAPGIAPEEARRIAIEAFMEKPEPEKRADYFLKLHAAAKGQECWICHFEHQDRAAKYPAGFSPGQHADAGGGWKSVLASAE